MSTGLVTMGFVPWAPLTVNWNMQTQTTQALSTFSGCLLHSWFIEATRINNRICSSNVGVIYVEGHRWGKAQLGDFSPLVGHGVKLGKWLLIGIFKQDVIMGKLQRNKNSTQMVNSKLSISALNMYLHILNCSKHWSGQVAYMFPLWHADIEPVK